ncbi:DUF2332 domain-containing protein [Nocardia transvalensis]|uniref:DUF2332 domain-containing protein n=1 Tax=Nocardia transvalensis TaxID=37333 RepID=UPI001893AA41|nr:DUF2332 domain-containing protein [Nocardia transvalensis]MBF6328892.1 DUF2332 domain-containing protein [Nocardia transvalensis]
MSLVENVELHARACEKLGSPLYAALLTEVGRDLRVGGPCAQVLSDHADATREAGLPLRFMAAVHALALSGQAPELAACYPSTGALVRAGTETNRAAWEAFRRVVAERSDWIREWLTRPPQTNEVGRAVPLLAGLLAAVAEMPLPVRLLELGSSAGLNLRADHFRWVAGTLAWGPENSPVLLDNAWQGPVPAWLADAVRRHPRVTVVERRGCDPIPLDPLSPPDALALRAYVWPDQADRLARLDGALRLAEKIPAEVVPLGAHDFLAGIDLTPGTLTVVWHSVMRQYVSGAEWSLVQAELDRLAAQSHSDAGFAHICFEPQNTPDDRNGFLLTLRTGAQPPIRLARAKPHGIPGFIGDGRA